jgi:hypothetical protein
MLHKYAYGWFVKKKDFHFIYAETFQFSAGGGPGGIAATVAVAVASE